MAVHLGDAEEEDALLLIWMSGDAEEEDADDSS
jgi:hypothetical protein